MLLSRIFSLLLGTTLFVMIWSMQDGNHALHARGTPDIVPQRLEIQPESRPSPAATKPPLHVTSVAVSAPDSALWMFADEPTERIAER